MQKEEEEEEVIGKGVIYTAPGSDLDDDIAVSESEIEDEYTSEI